MRTPLYGHTSPETAHLVPDYPYGRKVRCRIRYWLEHDPKLGYRFVRQTEHPRKLVWNAPKKSTYTSLGACMYIDSDTGYVHWAGFSDWKAEEALAFVRDFPGAVTDYIRQFLRLKVARLEKGPARVTVTSRSYPSGEVIGEPSVYGTSDADRERNAEELAAWREVAEAARVAPSPSSTNVGEVAS